jgi:glucan phosphoethanolaminetransferase (alkaline phosphatase superfamily)
MATFLTGVWKERIGIANVMTMLAILMVLAGIALFLCTSWLFRKDHEKLRAAMRPL